MRVTDSSTSGRVAHTPLTVFWLLLLLRLRLLLLLLAVVVAAAAVVGEKVSKLKQLSSRDATDTHASTVVLVVRFHHVTSQSGSQVGGQRSKPTAVSV